MKESLRVLLAARAGRGLELVTAEVPLHTSPLSPRHHGKSQYWLRDWWRLSSLMMWKRSPPPARPSPVSCWPATDHKLARISAV
eukprot:6065897-Pyramimonas_sp.AAC.1